MRMYRAALMAGLLVMLPCALSACADDEIKRPDVTAPLMPELGPDGTLTYTIKKSHKAAIC